jgi:hypothetical protein
VIHYVPYDDLQARPNIVVDGAAAPGTVLTLSHWPKSGTPEALRADTSAGIVFNYLDSPAWHVAADAVSNNHFDEDGLIGIFAMLNPEAALARRRLLIDVATSGDFGVYATRDAARIAFTLSAYSDEDSSPLDKSIFALPYGAQAAALYRSLLDVLPRVVADVGAFRRFWESEDERLSATERLIDRGAITIEEQPSLDLAIVRVPEGEERAHPYALNTRTPCSRLLVEHGRHLEVRYRYEGWVQFRSRAVSSRVDLAPLAEELNREERTNGRWVFDGVEAITPRLHFSGPGASSIPAGVVEDRLEHHLRTGPPAWNPFG